MKPDVHNFKASLTVTPNKKSNQNVTEKIDEKNNQGKIIVLAGISGSGKTTVANILASDYNFFLLDKYVTRPLRKEEIEEMTERNSNRCPSCLWQF